MASVTYVCPRWAGLRIGTKIKFEGGVFVTDDPALQEWIEQKYEGYGVHVTRLDGPLVNDPGTSIEHPAMARVRAGRRSSQG